MKNLGAVTVCAVVLVASGCRSSRDYINEGDRLAAEHKYPAAVLLYRKAIQKDPRSADAYYKLGVAQRSAGNYGAAYESFVRAVALRPDFDSAQIELGNLYLGDYLIDPNKNVNVHRRIANIADRLLSKNPRSFAGLRFKGYLALSDRTPEEAISFFERAQSADPTQPDVALGLTQALLLAGRFPEARQTATDLIAKHKTFGSVYDVLYAYEMSAGLAKDAEALLRLKITNNPQDRDSVLQLAEHFWRTGRGPQSLQLIETMLHEDQLPWRTYAAAASFYQGHQEFDRALDALALGIKAHPEESSAFAGAKAQVLVAQKKPKEAIGLLSDTLQQHPDAVELRKARAGLLLDFGEAADHALALRDLEELARSAPQDLSIAFQLGRAYSLNGRPAQAIQRFEEVVRKQPEDIQALLALAELHSTNKRFQQSLQYTERLLELQPAFRNAKLLHATALVGLGQLDRARAEYSRLLREQPGYTEAKLQLAMLEVVLKHYPDAEKLFRDLYKPKTGDFRALKGIVELYAAQGQIDKAIAFLGGELAYFPDSLAVRSLLASAAVRGGKVDLAIQHYEWLLAKRPDEQDTYTQLGGLYQRKHDLNRAMAMFQKTVDMSSGDWRAIGRLAAVQEEAGMTSAAKANYRRALALGGDDPDLLNNLAYLEADTGSDMDAALALVQKALSRSPENSQYADTAGFIYLKRRDTAAALQIFQSLSKRFPNEAGYRYHLALALLQSGNRAQGEHELRAAVAADPSLADEGRVRSLLGGN